MHLFLLLDTTCHYSITTISCLSYVNLNLILNLTESPMLFADPPDPRGEEAVGEVVLRRGVGRDGHEQPPFAAAVARLFGQFALCRGEH